MSELENYGQMTFLIGIFKVQTQDVFRKCYIFELKKIAQSIHNIVKVQCEFSFYFPTNYPNIFLTYVFLFTESTAT